MIKRNNKKGFTIVELVIVIAVIAILAAVLIPTFAGIIKKANQSADIQAVRQMNTALAAEFAVEKPAAGDMDPIIDALSKNGFNSEKALIPVSKGYKFMWSASNNCIILLNDKNEVVFPEGITYSEADCTSLEDSVKYLDVVANDVATLQEALATGNQNITLSADATLTDEVTIPAGANVTLDLGGNTLTSEQATGGRSKYLNVSGTLTIVNGTIENRGVKVKNGGTLTIGKDANVVIANVDSDGGSALRIETGATVVIDGGKFTANNGDYKGHENDTEWKNESNWGAEPSAVYNAGTLTINGGEFETAASFQYAVTNYGGTMTINGGKFTGYRGVLACENGGTLTVNGGEFAVTGGDHAMYAIYCDNATVKVSGGTFIGNFTSNVEDTRK